MLLSSLPSIIPTSASPVFSSPCVDIFGYVFKLYELPFLSVLNSQEKLIQSARGKLELGPTYLSREYSFLKFTESNLSLDVKRRI